MSRFKPGAKYVYERADGVTYAREVGAHPGDRFAIGWDHGAIETGTKTFLGMPIEEVENLVAMSQAAKTNPALQDALNHATVIYLLTKPEETYTPRWHPV